MSPRKAPSSIFVQKSNLLRAPLHLPFDINAQTDPHEPSNQHQHQHLQPPDNLFQQSESLNTNLEQTQPLAGTLQESEPPNNCLVTVAPEEYNQKQQEIQTHIDYMKKQIAVERNVYIKGRIEENNVKLVDVAQNLLRLSSERSSVYAGIEQKVDLLAERQKEANDLHSGNLSNICFQDKNRSLEQRFARSVTLSGTKIAFNSLIELPRVEKLPKYCTWVFLDRNQRMTEEQTLANRRRIYYDQGTGETSFCSDSEGEKVEEGEEKKDFSESEDYLVQETLQEFGLSDIVVNLLASCFSRNPNDVQGRCEYFIKGGRVGGAVVYDCDKDLDAALDTFDNLFCRRCLIFDCRLHGCSQELNISTEKQIPWCSPDAEKEPCGPNCHLLVGRSPFDGRGVPLSLDSSKNSSTSSAAKSTSATSEPAIGSLNHVAVSLPPIFPAPEVDFVGGSVEKRHRKKRAEHVLLDKSKRRKNVLAYESNPVFRGSVGGKDLDDRSDSSGNNEGGSSFSQKAKSTSTKSSRRVSPALDIEKSFQCESSGLPQDSAVNIQHQSSNVGTFGKEELEVEKSMYKVSNCDRPWTTLEKSLVEKGLQIFGRNSCLIAKNVMNGLKKCFEIFMYMNSFGSELAGDGRNADVCDHNKVDGDESKGKQIQRRSRFLSRKGKVRRLKYKPKSSRYPLSMKRMSTIDGLNRHFNPCGCQSPCGKECGCALNGTTCEKFCGCPRSCKNRFRGCHCAKSQCRSRQCPCFAADRECDPDVCKNCWISCGDGTLGGPAQKGDNYECMNMNLFLRQQQKIVLARSDVAGWGAFLTSDVGKDEYIGEYTGEVISHYEAGKRGKLYDRINLSYLFDLNNQWVLDSFRMGDKLKFANHSSNPNCYAKVMLVNGDHRVGIYSKEPIKAGEEIFYNYQYLPSVSPAWAREPSSSKKKDVSSRKKGARKHVDANKCV